MARYKLENALRGTEPQEFDSDKEAWNTLRKTWRKKDDSIERVFIWLWKEIQIVIPINNEENYVEEYNSFYESRPIGYGGEDTKLMKVGEPSIETLWIPVLKGITSDTYKVK